MIAESILDEGEDWENHWMMKRKGQTAAERSFWPDCYRFPEIVKYAECIARPTWQTIGVIS